MDYIRHWTLIRHPQDHTILIYAITYARDARRSLLGHRCDLVGHIRGLDLHLLDQLSPSDEASITSLLRDHISTIVRSLSECDVYVAQLMTPIPAQSIHAQHIDSLSVYGGAH